MYVEEKYSSTALSKLATSVTSLKNG